MAKRTRNGSYYNGCWLRHLNEAERGEVLARLRAERAECLYEYLKEETKDTQWLVIATGSLAANLGMARANVLLAVNDLAQTGRVEVQKEKGPKPSRYRIKN
jgi:hypothetical protein